MDATYNLNGGFKPTLKRFADLDGPDFFPTPEWATFALTITKRLRGRYGSLPVAMVQWLEFLHPKATK